MSIRQTQCESCGNAFSCGMHTKICWCQTYASLKTLPEQFSDCLCPNCLDIELKSQPNFIDTLQQNVIEESK